MTITYTYHNVNTSNDVETLIPTLDRTKWSFVSTTVVKDGTETIYRKADAVEDHPASLRIGLYVRNGIQNISVAFETDMTGVDDDDATVLNGKARVTIALQIPKGSGVGNITGLMDMLGNTYSVMYNGVTTKVPNTSVITAFANKIPDLNAT